MLVCNYSITSFYESLSALTEEGYSRKSYPDSRHAGITNSNSIRESREAVEELLYR